MRNLVEEYRSRYERSSGPELTPFGPARGSRRARPPRRFALTPWLLIGLGLILLVGALFVIGSWGDDNDPGDESSATPTPEASAAPGGGGQKKKKEKQQKDAAAPTVVRLQIQPTGPVSVCVEDASGDPVINNVTLDANQDTETFRSKRFTMSFGTGEAVMRVDGKAYQVSDDAPVGYSVKAGGEPRRVSERPTCG